MLNRINELSAPLNISGSESSLSRHLNSKFSQTFSTFFDASGNLIVRKKGCGNQPKKILITAPLDVPGFLCLYSEKGKGYLAPTGSLSLESITGEELSDSKGVRYSLFHSKQKNSYYVKNSPIPGEAFRIKTDFKEDVDCIFGRFASRYALLAIMCRLIETNFQNDVCFAFTTGFETRAQSEVNLIKRERPDLVVLLGRTENPEDSPLLLIKDGKAFAQKTLLQRALDIEKRETLPLLSLVVDKSVTKAETVISYSDIPIISFALPARFPDKKEEKIYKSSCYNLEIFLAKFLNENFS